MHRYDGRPVGPAPPQDGDRRRAIVVRAGYGVVGDRYAGRPAHRDAQLTVLAVEALEAVAAETGAAPFDPSSARRTVVLRGAEVEALRGQRFALDSGPGPVLLGGGERAVVLLSDCLSTAGDPAGTALAGIDRLDVLCPLPDATGAEPLEAARALAVRGGGTVAAVRSLADLGPALNRLLA